MYIMYILVFLNHFNLGLLTKLLYDFPEIMHIELVCIFI